MARYRKIDPRIWNDAKFRSVSDHGKLVFFMLLTHPSMTALGAMRGTLSGLSEELGWKSKDFREAFLEVSRKGMAEYDERACLIALPNFLKYNQPESPNVVKAWVGALDLLPECDLKMKVIAWAKAFAKTLPKAFAEALPDAFVKNMPNQEQEPKQEPKQEPDKDDKPARKRASPKTPLPDDFGISQRIRMLAAQQGATRLDDRLEHFVGYAKANGKAYADWDAAFWNAIRDDWAKLGKLANGNDAAFAQAEREIFGQSERDITHESERL